MQRTGLELVAREAAREAARRWSAVCPLSPTDPGFCGDAASTTLSVLEEFGFREERGGVVYHHDLGHAWASVGPWIIDPWTGADQPIHYTEVAGDTDYPWPGKTLGLPPHVATRALRYAELAEFEDDEDDPAAVAAFDHRVAHRLQALAAGGGWSKRTADAKTITAGHATVEVIRN